MRIDICMESLGQKDPATDEMRSGETQAHQDGPSQRMRAKASTGFKNEEARVSNKSNTGAEVSQASGA